MGDSSGANGVLVPKSGFGGNDKGITAIDWWVTRCWMQTKGKEKVRCTQTQNSRSGVWKGCSCILRQLRPLSVISRENKLAPSFFNVSLKNQSALIDTCQLFHIFYMRSKFSFKLGGHLLISRLWKWKFRSTYWGISVGRHRRWSILYSKESPALLGRCVDLLQDGRLPLLGTFPCKVVLIFQLL